MGEFTHSADHGKSLAHALHDIVTLKTVVIALVTAAVGYMAFEFMRAKAE